MGTSDGGLLQMNQDNKKKQEEKQQREREELEKRQQEEKAREKQENGNVGDPQSEMSEEDAKVFADPNFQAETKRYITAYLNDHYKDKQVSEMLHKQITNLITNDLKEQWKKRVIEDAKAKEEQLQRALEERRRRDEEQKKLEKERLLKEEQERIRVEEERLKEEKRKKEAEEAQRLAEEEERKQELLREAKAEEQRKRLEEEHRQQVEEERNRRTAEEVERKKAEMEMRARVAEEERRKKEEEEELERARKRELIARQKQREEEEARKQEEEEKRKKQEEEEKRQKQEEEDKRKKQEIEASGEGEKKERPTKSILSNMLRSSLPHHDKSHDTASSSVVAARSSHVADSSQINATPVQSNIVLATETVHVVDKEGHDDKRNDDITDIFAEDGLEQIEELQQGGDSGDPNEKKNLKLGESEIDVGTMTDSDPKISQLIKLKTFQNLRKQQIESYLEVQFGKNYFSQSDLKGVIKSINENMRKDLKSPGSGLHGWLKDSMSEEEQKKMEKERLLKEEQERIRVE